MTHDGPVVAAPDAKDQSFAFVIVGMLASQALGTIATMTLPALAPAASASLGISSALIGYQISILAAAMLVSLLLGANLSMRWGACRVTQVGLSLCATGCLIATGPHAAFFFTSAIALGLGYGLLSPAASHLLIRYTPADRRNVLFSLKQTGVPLGGIATSLIAPAVATLFGWRWALVATAVLLAALILVLQTRRARWDDDRTADAPIVANPLEGITGIWRQRTLRNLAIAGALLVIPQIGLTTFTVVLFYVNIGKMVGPLFVANAYTWTGRYAIAFGCLSVVTAAALACLLTARGRPLAVAVQPER